MCSLSYRRPKITVPNNLRNSSGTNRGLSKGSTPALFNTNSNYDLHRNTSWQPKNTRGFCTKSTNYNLNRNSYKVKIAKTPDQLAAIPPMETTTGSCRTYVKEEYHGFFKLNPFDPKNRPGTLCRGADADFVIDFMKYHKKLPEDYKLPESAALYIGSFCNSAPSNRYKDYLSNLVNVTIVDNITQVQKTFVYFTLEMPVVRAISYADINKYLDSQPFTPIERNIFMQSLCDRMVGHDVYLKRHEIREVMALETKQVYTDLVKEHGYFENDYKFTKSLLKQGKPMALKLFQLYQAYDYKEKMLKKLISYNQTRIKNKTMRNALNAKHEELVDVIKKKSEVKLELTNQNQWNAQLQEHLAFTKWMKELTSTNLSDWRNRFAPDLRVTQEKWEAIAASHTLNLAKKYNLTHYLKDVV